MTKHTPGPWKLQQRTTAIGIIGADGYAVAAVRAKYPRMPEHRAIRDANARLIAEAPNLLEALIDLMGAAEEAWGSERPCVKYARAAIAKAEGRA